MDFNGKGYIQEEDFFKTLLCYRLPFSKDELHNFFREEKIFKHKADGTITFELFKKTFFPNRDGGVNDNNDDKQAQEATKVHDQILNNESAGPSLITQNLKKLEDQIRYKFTCNWTSVRKAFLDVDNDFDGFITAEDVIKLIGGSVNLKDIETLLKNRDSKRKGKVDFKDFCKWMGTAIEPCEGFYFRHDSVKNPQYENNVRK